MKKLFIFVFVFILLTQIVSAFDLNFVPKLELCTEQQCYSSTDEISLEPEIPIILKLSIINDQRVWICWDALEYKFNLNSETLKDGKIIVQKWITKESGKEPYFCLSPNKKYENVFFIPLLEYNSLEKDKQQAKWSITEFYLYFDNLKCYDSIKLEKQICWSTASNSFKGDGIEFDVQAKKPTKGLDLSETTRTLFKLLSIVTGIFLIICIEEVVRNNKKKRFIWGFMTLITLIIGYFFVKYGFW